MKKTIFKASVFDYDFLVIKRKINLEGDTLLLVDFLLFNFYIVLEG